MNPYLGEIIIFAGNFAPVGWALCNGQLLAIQAYSALFSILGTTYGGNGVSDFALPDLRGRVPIHAGQAPGLSNYYLGQVAGSENVTLTTSQMPIHNHLVDTDLAGGNATPATPGIQKEYPGPAHILGPSLTDKCYSENAPNSNLNPRAIGSAGGSQPHTNIQPYLTVNFIIALQGIFPTRN
jgi:microcystin-dependent protein